MKKRKHTIKINEIVLICGNVYCEQRENNTFSTWFNYADEVRKRVSDIVKHKDFFRQMSLDVYVTNVIECQIPVMELLYREPLN